MTEPDRRILDLMAIMGDATSHAVLRVLLEKDGLDEEALLNALRRLRAAGLISDRMDGIDVAYSIIHPLVQEVAYAELPEMERRRAHLKAIEAIESFSAARPDELNRLARQYMGAGPEADSGRALAVLMAAGDKALGLFANEEAARHYMAALAIVRRWHSAGGLASFDESFQEGLPWLLERLGEVLNRTSDHAPAVAMWNEALGERERAGDVLAVSRLRGKLARAEWDQGHFEVAGKHLSAGLAGLVGQKPCQELADLLFTRFSFVSRLRDVAGLADTAAQFLSLAERLASPTMEAEANCVAAHSDLWQHDVAAAREHALHALTVTEREEELVLCCRVHAILVNIGMYVGDHRLIHHHSSQGLAIARRVGESCLEIFFRSHLALAHFMSGAWNESQQMSLEVLPHGRRLGMPRALAYALAERAITLAFQGDLVGAEACICEAREVSDSRLSVDRYSFGFVDIADAALALERGQVERALDIATGFDRQPSTNAAFAGLAPPHLPIGLMLLAEAQAAAGDAGGALETARKLIGLNSTDTPYLNALASRAEGLALQVLGQREAAIACLARSHGIFNELAMPFESARSLLEQAEIGVQVSVRRPPVPDAQSPTPSEAARQSLAIFERLGAQHYVERARGLLQEPDFAPPVVHRTLPTRYPLSKRELELARLVAEGLTTPEIAQRLTISRRTVSTHLTQIYTRLGIGSRSALARLITQAGLLSPLEEV